MDLSKLAQLTHLEASFSSIAAAFIGEVRRQLFVPEHADDDVEDEFVALRQRVDAYYPEFCAIFASSLLDQLGPERLQELLDQMNTEAAQRYLEVAEKIQLELQQSAPSLTHKLTAAAQSALAHPGWSPAPTSGQRSALSLARVAGVGRTLYDLAQAVTRQVLLEHRGNAAEPQLLTSPDAQRIQGLLVGMLAGFHARLFIRHVGEPHVASVVAELDRKPLRDYVSARVSAKPAVDRALEKLFERMTRELL
ncbi:MAG TPA: hypothetical protein VFS67_16505 [Polyangiaceae bacterium]|nr:hypothetical protein [Polyangiaceae bacterium]